jgi:hypothetical protein
MGPSFTVYRVDADAEARVRALEQHLGRSREAPARRAESVLLLELVARELQFDTWLTV